MKKDLRELIEQCIDQAGADAVEDALHAILEERHERTLTIVVNDWQHPLQDVHSRGEIFILSRGSFDYTNAKARVNNLLTEIKSRSTGAEIYFDTKIWNAYPVSFGVRFSHLLDKDLLNPTVKNRWEIIIPIGLIPD